MLAVMAGYPVISGYVGLTEFAGHACYAVWLGWFG
jgi:hypothetical protein